MLQRVKRITSHAGYARFLAECEETTYSLPRQTDIPSPYAYSPEWDVYRHQEQYVIIRETMHKRYDVFDVPVMLLTPRQD